MENILIYGGEIINGLGSPSYKSDILISNSKISAIGNFSNLDNIKKINAKGKIVCPGFIDIHSHADFSIYVDGLCQSALRQGITTVVTGNCGHGPAPAPNKELAIRNTIGYNEEWKIGIKWSSFQEYLEKLFENKISMNLAPLVPHGTIRLAAMGPENRKPNSKEISLMEDYVKEAMSAGAIGLSSGLEYAPGQYANEAELTTLGKVVSKFNGIYASHIRERGDNFESAVIEALNVAKNSEIPAQLSHLAPRPYAPKNSLNSVLSLIDDSRKNGMQIGIDTFPDIWGPAHLLDLLPREIIDGTEKEILLRLNDPETALKCEKYIQNRSNYLLRTGGFDSFFLSNTKSYPEFLEKSLEEISEIFNLNRSETILKLASADGIDFQNVLIRHIFANQSDLDQLLLNSYCSVESDGVVGSKSGILKTLAMNRSSFGYAPRFIQEYSIERKLFTLEESIRKMTSLPASSAKISNRGVIKENMKADIVIMDVNKIKDNTTDSSTMEYPDGIETVLVNGQIVINDENHSGIKCGELVK